MFFRSQTFPSNWRRLAGKLSLVAGALLSFIALPAMGTVVPLSDSGVTANIDLSSGAGLTSLNINGVNQVNSTSGQWYFIRVRPPSAAAAATPLNDTTFSLTTTATTSTLDADYIANGLQPAVAGVALPTYGVEVNYTGLVGATNQAQLPQSITITDIASNGPLTISLYEYNHFNLNGQTNDNVTFLNSPVNTTDQNSTTGASMSEVNTTPNPNSYQAAAGSTLLSDLTSGSFDGLNDTNTVSTGSNDAAWAFEWDFTIPDGSSVQISKNVNVTVPEPATISLAIGGMSLLSLRRRRRGILRRINPFTIG
jgi:hypothetical protein